MDDGLNGPKWPLLYTIPDLQKNLIDRFELEGKDRFEAFGHCIFGLSNTYLGKVLEEVDDRSNNNFDKAIVLCIEKVVGVKYLQDTILRWLEGWKKPYVLNLNKFRRCCDKCYSYAKGKYT